MLRGRDSPGPGGRVKTVPVTAGARRGRSVHGSPTNYKYCVCHVDESSFSLVATF